MDKEAIKEWIKQYIESTIHLTISEEIRNCSEITCDKNAA